jgi:hypothetical protein
MESMSAILKVESMSQNFYFVTDQGRNIKQLLTPVITDWHALAIVCPQH